MNEWFPELANTVWTVQRLPEPEVLSLTGELALDDGGVGGGEGAGGPGQGGLHGGDEIEEAPGDDDVVVTTNYSRHHTAAIAHTTQARVNLTEAKMWFLENISFHFLTFFQAPAAPTLSFCPRPSSNNISGIPTNTNINKKGRMKAPGHSDVFRALVHFTVVWRMYVKKNADRIHFQ